MQPKKKYSIESYAVDRGNPVLSCISFATQKTSCICSGNLLQDIEQCYRCGNQVHSCVRPSKNRSENRFECQHCLSYYLDPLFPVRRVLLESYFRTENIFEVANVISFEFTTTPEQIQSLVEVRCLSEKRINLSWPMQGSFYLNDSKTPLLQLKPLMSNSNKCYRKDEYLLLPTNQLRETNVLRFVIPRLEENAFVSRYQFERRGVYFLTVNIVTRLTKEELVAKTLRQNRIDKRESLSILCNLNRISDGMAIVQNKVSLICPYTKERIKVPVRGRHCIHYACICLETLAITHVTSRGWSCPICSERLNEPRVDMWVMAMLNDNAHGFEVLVKDDGTYVWLGSKLQSNFSLSDSDSETLILGKLQQHTTLMSLPQQTRNLKTDSSNLKTDPSNLVLTTTVEANIVQTLPSVGSNSERVLTHQSQSKIPETIKFQQILKLQPVTAAKYITIIDIEDDPIPAQSNGDIKIDSFEKGMSKLKVSLRDSRFQEAKHKESKTSDDSPIKSRKLRRQRTPDQEASFDTGKKKTVTEWQDKSNSRRCQSNLSHMSPTLLLDVPRLHFKEMKKDEFIKKFNIQTPKACSLPLTYEFRKMFQEVL